MLKEMRRKDRQLTEETARKILKKGEYGILSTVGDNYPYSVPVNYVVVDNFIYIHGTSVEGQKSENIKKNPKVCFTVVGDTEVLADKFSERYESTIVLGTIELAEEHEKITALQEFVNKYSSEFKESGSDYIMKLIDRVAIHKIKIEHITGKARR